MDNYIGNAPLTTLMPSSGRLLQVASNVRTDIQSSSAIIPLDDTIPQIGEGDQFFTVAFTPTAVGNRVRLRLLAFLCGSIGAGNVNVLVAMFRAGQANALAAGIQADASNVLSPFTMEYEFIAADVAPTTFSVRMGVNSGAEVARLNSISTGRLLGGAMTSFLKVEEYSA